MVNRKEFKVLCSSCTSQEPINDENKNEQNLYSHQRADTGSEFHEPGSRVHILLPGLGLAGIKFIGLEPGCTGLGKV